MLGLHVCIFLHSLVSTRRGALRRGWRGVRVDGRGEIGRALRHLLRATRTENFKECWRGGQGEGGREKQRKEGGGAPRTQTVGASPPFRRKTGRTAPAVPTLSWVHPQAGPAELSGAQVYPETADGVPGTSLAVAARPIAGRRGEVTSEALLFIPRLSSASPRQEKPVQADLGFPARGGCGGLVCGARRLLSSREKGRGGVWIEAGCLRCPRGILSASVNFFQLELHGENKTATGLVSVKERKNRPSSCFVFFGIPNCNCSAP